MIVMSANLVFYVTNYFCLRVKKKRTFAYYEYHCVTNIWNNDIFQLVGQFYAMIR